LKVFFAALNKKLAPQTVETVFRKSKTWFEFLVREEILMVNPFNGLKNIKLDRTVLPHLKQAEVEHILKAIGKPRTLIELRNALIFHTALDTGLRLSELADLEREDLDLPRLIVRRGKMGPSGQTNDWRITKS
jgi:integrase/recombinase XerC